jgi:hypothetical protein
MNEYKNPIKKMWQQANQSIADGNNVQLAHTVGTATPTTTPAKVGLLFIDTTNATVYISTGTTDSGDWTPLN